MLTEPAAVPADLTRLGAGALGAAVAYWLAIAGPVLESRALVERLPGWLVYTALGGLVAMIVSGPPTHPSLPLALGAVFPFLVGGAWTAGARRLEARRLSEMLARLVAPPGAPGMPSAGDIVESLWPDE